MTPEQLKSYNPLAYRECQTIEDINARIILKRDALRYDFKFYMHLAATMGGTWDKENKRFKVHLEHNPQTGETEIAQIRISDFITENSVIKKSGMVYVSDFKKSWAENRLKVKG